MTGEKRIQAILSQLVDVAARPGEAVQRLKRDAAIDGVILACTELPLILTQDQYGLPFLNTTEIHVRRWKQIRKVKYLDRQRTIMLRAGFGETAAVFCTEENYMAVRQDIERRVRQGTAG
jgi:hypothetical protein